jgi:hypothetical protein
MPDGISTSDWLPGRPQNAQVSVFFFAIYFVCSIIQRFVEMGDVRLV